MPGHSASERYGRFVGVIGRIKNDNLVVAPNDGLNRGEQSFGCAAADSNFKVKVDFSPMNFLGFDSNRRSQRGNLHWRPQNPAPGGTS